MSWEPINPAIEAVLMMLPLFCLSITGSTCFSPRNTPTDVDHPAQCLQGIFRDRRDIALDAGIIGEHVDRAELVDAGADISRDLVLIGNIGRDGERLRRGRQILDRGLQVLLPAVDGNDARAAFGQKAHGRGANDARSPGDDGNLAIETNSIGHVWHFPWLVRLSRIFMRSARRPRELSSAATISSGVWADQWPGRRQTALSPPYSAC